LLRLPKAVDDYVGQQICCIGPFFDGFEVRVYFTFDETG
jgi:hypothetical protein